MRLVPCLIISLGLMCAADAQVSDRAAARFLDQATWGATPASIAQVEKQGFAAWLQAQFALNTSDLPDQPLLNSAGNNNNNLAPVQAAFFQNAVTGQDQLRQRVAFALSQIWVVSAESGVPNAYAYPPYWRIFRDNAFGNYRDLIKAVTLSPAMGRYLNMANNNKGNPAKGTAANENYAREVMQLFTLGLTQLNPDGTPVLDQNQQPVPTYNQAMVTNYGQGAHRLDVSDCARAPRPRPTIRRTISARCSPWRQSTIRPRRRFSAETSFPPDRPPSRTWIPCLTDMMDQPTMAPFVSQQLIQHLVTSNPSPAYIQRVSQCFHQRRKWRARKSAGRDHGDPDGSGSARRRRSQCDPGGQLRPSARADPFHGQYPARPERDPGRQAAQSTTTPPNMGQNLFYAPSVFSYFSPQYRTEHGLLGPEFQIYSTGTAAERGDIVNSIIYGTLDKSTRVNLDALPAAGRRFPSMLNYIGYVFLHSSMSRHLQAA